jgi:UDP-N-acetylglucosamine/UDP-N-acetylgalactosamine diphosphorylase
MSMERLERLKKMLEGCDQAHVVASFTSLSPDEQNELLDDIEASDWWPSLQGIFASSMSQGPSGPLHAEPVKNVTRLDDPSIDRESWYKRGLELIAEGKVGVLLLAGGQGTRLGSLGPKGCYDIGLPSHKSLFQLQAERISKVKGLAGDQKSLPWYIMTSQFTHKETIDHFEALNYFNLPKEDVVFFQQGFLPCLTEQGKIIMETPSKMAKAPDGNGGVYLSLERSGCLADMKKRGIECLDVYCIDNALARVCDPSFIGYCSSHRGGRGTEVGARVVAKAYPEERVGVFATLTGDVGLRVLEYSELDPSLATAPDPTLPGSLLCEFRDYLSSARLSSPI